MRSLNRVFWLGVCCAMSACGDDSIVPEPPSLSGKPILLDEQVVFVDRDQKQAFLLDLSQSQPKAETQHIELPPQAVRARLTIKMESSLQT